MNQSQRTATHHRLRGRTAEQELAALNSNAEATLALDAEAWDDATRDIDWDCARYCKSHGLGTDAGVIDTDAS